MKFLPLPLTPRRMAKAALMSLALATAILGIKPVTANAQERALVIARDMDVNSLDPARAWCDTCQIYDTAVYEQLVTLDKDNKLQALLATSWEANADQTQFTFKLNPAAKFSDGSAVEAKDVKWSFERVKNIKGSGSFLAEPITGIETPDAQTVVVTLNKPNSEFLNQVAAGFLGVINSDVASANGALSDATAVDKDTSENWFLTASAGSGPFVLASYEPNAELRLKRNDAYWGKPAGVPEVVFRQVKDAVAQAQMLQSGTVDIAMQIDPETAKTLEGTEIVVERVPSFNFVYIAMSPGAKANTVPLTADVREAISIAIDRTSLIDFTLGGAGRPMAAPIPLGFPGGDGHPIPEYNPERAKELLAKAGVPDGFTIQSTYPDLNVYGVDFSLMMQKIQQDLAKVGIKVELSPVPFANWREVANGDHIPLTAVFFAPDFFGSSQYVDVFGLAEGSVWAKRAGSATDPSIVNPKTAELMAKALAAPTPEEADKLWFEAGTMMAEARIIVPMVSPDLILAYGPTIKGVRYSACCNLPLAEITN
ncbi:MAG: bacterial extracellular solute-binding s, 5 Middle family protein [Cypionkella sp.]|uniref:ABC transporter substrate-binding protein n=1 Tax=Cypionkella sp. TaxID=2811411 RepID=UPI00261B9F92|nr:ABC transporter substrate-binding protein [Cypionkella sp.]MDB5657389.1 bacterial extracellular solute-binding s, 5 Middle family protein [Cypionkella sp.]